MRELNIGTSKGFSDIARFHGGLNLKPEKLDFFRQRLQRRVMDLDLEDFQTYLNLLRSNEGKSEIKPFIESLTTHTTSFYREPRHFEFLVETGFPSLVEDGAGKERPLRIWSAAGSTGAELYTAMIAATEFGTVRRGGLQIMGFGTDLSQSIVDRAALGLFTDAEITGLTETHRKRYLLRSRNNPSLFRIAPEIRRLTKWTQANLTELRSEGPPEADVVFVRNVLIYFDNETQEKVIRDLARRVRPGGFLMTGHSETLTNIPAGFTSVQPSVYQKKE